ncbi:MAG: methionyl-tRNA formyltransferase [Patescibacteria group bacterium]
MKKIKIAYFGSPDFAADFLEKLIIDTTINQLIEVKLVVTQPDQKVGRKQILTPTPVRQIAEKYNRSEDVKFFSLSGLGAPAVIKNFDIELKDIELALVYAFGDLIPKELLSLPKYGFWNIHPSLLPKYRGPSPIATPLINGDKTTGVTIIKMDEEIDHGPIIAQESYTIKNTDYRTDLETKLTDLGFEMFKKTVIQLAGSWVNGLKIKEQNHNKAIYTNKLSKDDGFIEFKKLKLKIKNSSEDLYNLFRGLYPWPGIWTILPNGKRLKITRLTMKQSDNLTIDSVQLEGKTEVDFFTFNKAYNIF